MPLKDKRIRVQDLKVGAVIRAVTRNDEQGTRSADITWVRPLVAEMEVRIDLRPSK
jgi:hypothetical protein